MIKPETCECHQVRLMSREKGERGIQPHGQAQGDLALRAEPQLPELTAAPPRCTKALKFLHAVLAGQYRQNLEIWLVSASANDNHVSAVVHPSTPAASLWDASAGASSCNLEMSFRRESRVVQRRTSRQHQLGKRVVPESVECSWLNARPRQRSLDSLAMMLKVMRF